MYLEHCRDVKVMGSKRAGRRLQMHKGLLCGRHWSYSVFQGQVLISYREAYFEFLINRYDRNIT